jgi:sugar phosphate isomerase/epimerase
MMPAYPTPSPAWMESWHAMMAKYRLTPTLMDTFVDVECGGHRRLTLEEGVQQLVTQMKLAKSLGFKIIRPTTGPVADSAPDLIRLALPYAEELDVRIAPEIHAPIPLRGAYIESYLELIARTKTRHAGFTLDFGVFCKRLPPAQVAYALRLGAQPKVIDYVAKAYIDGVDPKRVEEYILANSPTPADQMMIHRYSAFGPAANEPSQLKDILPYVFNCHGKFYEFTEQGVEESIPYPEVLKALADAGYQGSIDSEYEGQRLTQDAFVTDSCEQVRRQHLAMRRVLS